MQHDPTKLEERLVSLEKAQKEIVAELLAELYKIKFLLSKLEPSLKENVKKTS